MHTELQESSLEELSLYGPMIHYAHLKMTLRPNANVVRFFCIREMYSEVKYAAANVVAE